MCICCATLPPTPTISGCNSKCNYDVKKSDNSSAYGDGTQTRSFQYVDDLVNGLIKMMETEDDYFGPVNIGNPGEFTMNELAQIVKELIPESTSNIVYKELGIKYNTYRCIISKFIRGIRK